MKSFLLISSFVLTLFYHEAHSQTQTVHVNSLGYLPHQTKKASIVGESKSFTIKKTADQTIVYRGNGSRTVFQQDVNQDVSVVDFSSFDKKGNYYLETAEGSKSLPFEISANVYHQPFYTAMRGFYLWRCGTAVEGKHNSLHFAHDACHMEDGYEDFVGNPGVRRDGTKGWHDAGDYGKYVVNAGVTVGVLFLAWDHFQSSLKKISLDLPETAPGIPDFLKEIKWETDWLLTMQYTDGSGKVSHKLTRKKFEPFCKPEDDKERRYFTDWSSAAVADFVAMMAQAARYFKPYDAIYAQKCLTAAHLSYQFLKDNPGEKKFEQGEFSTGGYQTTDKDDRLWAAAEMWQTTGNQSFLKDFEAQAKAISFKIFEDWDWGNVSNLGMFEYAMSKRTGKEPEILKAIQNNILATANAISKKAGMDVYGRPLGGSYYWGCNGSVARQVVILEVANRIGPDKAFIEASQDAIAHLFGRNYYNRSFVTGLGTNPAMNPHDRRSGSDKEIDPWPGYLVGGGHTATGWNDKQDDYRTNEIAINWQAALVYALAGLMNN
jgi:endoglucanase